MRNKPFVNISIAQPIVFMDKESKIDFLKHILFTPGEHTQWFIKENGYLLDTQQTRDAIERSRRDLYQEYAYLIGYDPIKKQQKMQKCLIESLMKKKKDEYEKILTRPDVDREELEYLLNSLLEGEYKYKKDAQDQAFIKHPDRSNIQTKQAAMKLISIYFRKD